MIMAYLINAMFERSNIAAKLRYLQIEKIHGKEQNNFVIFFFILLK